MIDKLRKALANCCEASYEGNSKKELEVVANELFIHLRLLENSWNKGDMKVFSELMTNLLGGR